MNCSKVGKRLAAGRTHLEMRLYHLPFRFLNFTRRGQEAKFLELFVAMNWPPPNPFGPLR
jgi:hypothetical protein